MPWHSTHCSLHLFLYILSFPYHRLLDTVLFLNIAGPLTLREKCPNKEFFLVRIFPYSDWIRVSLRIQSKCGKIRTRKNSVFGHFSRSVSYLLKMGKVKKKKTQLKKIPITSLTLPQPWLRIKNSFRNSEASILPLFAAFSSCCWLRMLKRRRKIEMGTFHSNSKQECLY